MRREPYEADLDVQIGEARRPFDVAIYFHVDPATPARITVDPYDSVPPYGGDVDIERCLLYAGPAPDTGWNAIAVTEGELEALGCRVDTGELYDLGMEDDY